MLKRLWEPLEPVEDKPAFIERLKKIFKSKP
jgi:hypothetical protein